MIRPNIKTELKPEFGHFPHLPPATKTGHRQSDPCPKDCGPREIPAAPGAAKVVLASGAIARVAKRCPFRRVSGGFPFGLLCEEGTPKDAHTFACPTPLQAHQFRAPSAA